MSFCWLEHSIIKQSQHAGLLMTAWGQSLRGITEVISHIQLNHSLNGDGCGIGWYTNDKDTPCMLTSTKPAWNNSNIYQLAGRLIFMLPVIECITVVQNMSALDCFSRMYGQPPRVSSQLPIVIHFNLAGVIWKRIYLHPM
jgi:hypothetical protein